MPTRPYRMPCNTSPGHMIYYVMPDRPYHAIPHQTITYTMPYLASPHIPCDAHQTIPFTMLCPPDHTIYHAMPANHIPCHACHAISYTYHPARPHHTSIPSHISPGNTICHAMSARTYHVPCKARQAIPYTTLCPLSHSIYIPCPQGHTIYHARHAKP